jgi:large subunit ribosomal protein L3
VAVKALITRKIGMASIIDESGASIAVTLLSASPNVITQIKTNEIDGYEAVQLGFEETKKLSKALEGHFKTAKASPKVVREFRLAEAEELNVGDTLEADVFEVGEDVQATGTSKGKGWAGTIKRHNFHRGRKTHGGRSYRRPGSIGSMYPQRIFPGKKMAGHMGHDRVTNKGLKVALIDKENSLIGVTGSVPGPRKGIVLLQEIK